jgi:RNA polymerase sigma factor (sigma-70 family)
MSTAASPRPPADSEVSSATSRELLRRARAGDTRALSTLFRRQGDRLSRWARGRLPRWARRFADTADLVQDALLHTFRRIDQFDDRGRGALQAYLRQAVQNRMRDELRRIQRRPASELADDPPDTALSPLETTLDVERAERYKHTLSTLDESDRILIVARLEMDYTYEQLALISNRPTPEAARKALRRAVVKLAAGMSHD